MYVAAIAYPIELGYVHTTQAFQISVDKFSWGKTNIPQEDSHASWIMVWTPIVPLRPHPLISET